MNNKEIAHLVTRWANWLIIDGDANPLGYPSRSTEGRLMQEGGRVDGKPPGAIVPLRQMPSEIARVHVVIKGMPMKYYEPMICKHCERDKDAILNYCKRNNIGISKYYRLIDSAYTWIASGIHHLSE